LSRSWREPGELVQILVSRKGDAQIASAGFLVDLGCLGVKDALTNVLAPPQYEAFRSSYARRQPMKRADLDLVAKIIQEGIAYAGRLGFSPHPDYHDAAFLPEGADPASCTTPIPLGMNGKPFYIPGPFDNPAGIVRQLDRAVGPGNFHYVLELNDLPGAAEMGIEVGEPEARRSSFLPRLLRRLRPGRGRRGGGD
ncbi:MAG: hypothetical protein JOZ41_17330, partial [Chloroflexi bacterium]|nr:hypothetical protein [Chloroflexota bacterium]